MSTWAGERVVRFNGVRNFRDVGGYPSRDGGTVRWGCVYRAGVLDLGDAVDRARFERLGVRTVFDLRSDAEWADRPGLDGARRVEILSRGTVPAELSAGPGDGVQLPDLRDLYIGMLDHGGDGFAKIFTALISEPALPAVIHCHAGKDRTGVVVAALLDALGVARELVLDDYEMSPPLEETGTSTTARLLAYGYEPAAAAAMLVPSRAAMRAALEHLDARYGGGVDYLLAVGLTLADLARLRDRLIEPAI